MSRVDARMLLQRRRHLSIVHHIAGLLRLRVRSTLSRQASDFDGNRFRVFLEAVDGIVDVRINPAAASVIVEYDPKRFSPEFWETLIEGSDQDAAQLFGEFLANHEHLGIGVEQ